MESTDLHQRTQGVPRHITAYSHPDPDDRIEPAPIPGQKDHPVREPEAEPASATKREAMARNRKSFTAEKLTWLNYLMTDHQQELAARQVGFIIAQSVNEETREGRVSDRVISDRLGISVRTVVTSRQALHAGGWITWHKPDPRAANRTKIMLTDENIRRIDACQAALKDRREFEGTGRSRTGT